ncbi:carbohydrate ABC transporter permease [Paenibacillus puerhi]|uniref:carbohydrate ABC transporter permease n=1 Tax=Paenibacillus puerhi TaxID=2692622 RepID=UPI00191525F4|nr:carbohydrate ABC transporter permease [Paenibacillus puerhi]
MQTSMSANKRGLSILRGIVLFFLVLFCLFPLVWMAFLAFRTPDAMFEPFWRNLSSFSTETFVSTLQSGFTKSIWNSFLAASISMIVAMVIGTPAAFALAKWSIKRKYIWKWVIQLLRMAPPVGFAIPLFLAYINLGMIDTLPGLILSYVTFTVPLVIWLMWMFFSQIPNELMEAAWMDGSSIWRSFLTIALPLSTPGLVAAGILSFIFSWNDFFFALILTRANTSTGPVAVMNFLTESSYNWGGIASAGLILSLPTLPVIFFMSKYIVQGLTSGAVKG